MIKTLLKYAGPYKKESILAPLCVTAEVLLEITIPLLMSRIVDVGIANRGWRSAPPPAAGPAGSWPPH